MDGWIGEIIKDKVKEAKNELRIDEFQICM